MVDGGPTFYSRSSTSHPSTFLFLLHPSWRKNIHLLHSSASKGRLCVRDLFPHRKHRHPFFSTTPHHGQPAFLSGLSFDFFLSLRRELLRTFVLLTTCINGRKQRSQMIGRWLNRPSFHRGHRRTACGTPNRLHHGLTPYSSGCQFGFGHFFFFFFFFFLLGHRGWWWRSRN